MTTRPNRQTWSVALFGLMALGIGACSTSDASQTSSDAGDGTTPVVRPTVPTGTSLTFRIDEEISTDTHKSGDRFTSTLTGDAMGVEGETLIPAGSMGIWTVVQSEKDNGEGESVLVVRLDQVRLDGARYPVAATVISTNLQKDGADSKKETAAKIGIGAAAGALAGRLLGDDAKDALKGATVGAAMGTVVALSTRDGSAKLPAGSRMVARLDEPLVLNR